MSAQAGGGAGRPAEGAAQPLFDLGFNPETIKARLSAVPVFAVVNNKNEFVLVAGEVGACQPQGRAGCLGRQVCGYPAQLQVRATVAEPAGAAVPHCSFAQPVAARVALLV